MLGWITWAALFVVTALLSFDLFYRPLSVDEGYSLAFSTMVFLWWISLGWIFHHGAFNKLHLLWLSPLAALLPTHVLPVNRMNHSFVLADTHPVSFVILLSCWLILLWWLTPYSLVCPGCGSYDCRRSGRRNRRERLYALARVRPFRCRTCNHRFWRIGRLFPKTSS
jgi:hypothetical protein